MKNKKQNFDLFSSYSFFTPGAKGLVVLFIWFLVGSLIGNVLTSIITLVAGADAALDYGTLIAYPVMFIPAMMYASLKSKGNSFFDKGYALSSDNYGKTGGFLCALIAAGVTFTLGFVVDLLSCALPEPPQWFTDIMDSMTQGNFWVNFICVSIFAPVFEEWLCRGEVLRGLLNFKRKDGGNGIKPVWAIVISALFFALIHANPWQALPAFCIGLLLGYVYYKTGSLKLTMLMHFTNNTISLLLSRVPQFSEADNWKEVLPAGEYWVIFAACVLFSVLAVRTFSRIELKSPQGNCDPVSIN